MLLPELGSKVWVWPMPGRMVQDGPRPVDVLGGGRWLPPEGREVIWSPFHVEQYRAGDLLLHAPPGAAPPEEVAVEVSVEQHLLPATPHEWDKE